VGNNYFDNGSAAAATAVNATTTFSLCLTSQFSTITSSHARSSKGSPKTLADYWSQFFSKPDVLAVTQPATSKQ